MTVMTGKRGLYIMGKVYKAMNIISGEMKTAWDYGIGFPLYHSEVHLLEAIRLREGANAGEIARFLGISNAAVSQVAKKLTKKALIETYRATDNQKEIFFRLTALGEKARNGHQKHHKKIHARFLVYYKRLDKKEIEVIVRFLDEIEWFMPGKK
jgi:DNA-binding MarR family transcriptional regulator